jgi:hypothetical protein
MSDIKARIVVDEDWKARVQRERETVRAKPQSAQPPSPQASPGTPEQDETPVASAAQSEPAAGGGVHPAFEALIGTLATQAMYCLGFMGAPGQSQVVINLEQAKEAIDMVVMLREKTQGNLSAEEDAVLSETLMELQRLFAARVQQAQAQAMQQAGVDPSQLRGQPPY